MNIVRGSVHWAYLDPTEGGEQKGRRPVVVLSPNEIQDYLGRAIVVPVTSTNKGYPTFVPVTIKDIQYFAMLDQMRTLDKSRFKGEISVLSAPELMVLLDRVKEMFSV